MSSASMTRRSALLSLLTAAPALPLAAQPAPDAASSPAPPPTPKSAGMEPTEFEAHLRANGCFARPSCAATAWVDATGVWGLRGTPAGGSFSTVDDLLRFGQALRAGRLLKPATRDLFTARKVAMDRRGGPIDGYACGFGDKLVKGLRTVGHNGGTPGATAQFDLYETRPLTMVVLTNYDAAQMPVTMLLRRELV